MSNIVFDSILNEDGNNFVRGRRDRVSVPQSKSYKHTYNLSNNIALTATSPNTPPYPLKLIRFAVYMLDLSTYNRNGKMGVIYTLLLFQVWSLAAA